MGYKVTTNNGPTPRRKLIRDLARDEMARVAGQNNPWDGVVIVGVGLENGSRAFIINAPRSFRLFDAGSGFDEWSCEPLQPGESVTLTAE